MSGYEKARINDGSRQVRVAAAVKRALSMGVPCKRCKQAEAKVVKGMGGDAAPVMLCRACADAENLDKRVSENRVRRAAMRTGN
jgi:hypothetical protein